MCSKKPFTTLCPGKKISSGNSSFGFIAIIPVLRSVLLPAFQRFFALLQQRYGAVAPQEIRDEFRRESLPLMKYTNILSFNTRVTVLFISLLINEPWLYFVFELTVLNGLLIYMIWQHERLSNKLYKEIQMS